MSFIKIRGHLYDLTEPRVMGILNVTPDSFYDDSRANDKEGIIQKADRMVSAGVDIIDVGGYSSRPGADDISKDEEIRRLSLALSLIRKKHPDLILSVDTFRAEVVDFAVQNFGVDIINDISGGLSDPGMAEQVAKSDVPYIMMHMKGTPRTMQLSPDYENVVSDLLTWFSKRIESFRNSGVKDIIVDPGFGFGKTIDHNFQILKSLDKFSILGCPIAAGLSRKSMIWKVLDDIPGSESALTGTIALNSIALFKGASIIRVHDVKQAADTVKLIQRLK